VVLSNVHLLFGRPKPGSTEIDFVVIHPDRGICVLEAKPGTFDVDEGTWFQKSRDGRRTKLRRSPFVQAEDEHKELQRFLWNRLGFPRDADMAHGVVFPDVAVDSNLGPDAPTAITVGRTELPNIETALARIFRFYDTRLSLSDADLERMVGLLMPSLELIVTRAADVAVTEEGIQRETRERVPLTESQLQVVRGMNQREQLAVLGEAGTGKTVLAIERAKRLSDMGLRTLLLCHRGAVAAFMRTSLGGGVRRRFDLSSPEMLTVVPYDEFRTVLAAESGVSRRASPLWLLDAAVAVGLSFDAIVIDEAQEFTAGDVQALAQLLPKPDESPSTCSLTRSSTAPCSPPKVPRSAPSGVDATPGNRRKGCHRSP
jgi:hypothetical protein